MNGSAAAGQIAAHVPVTEKYAMAATPYAGKCSMRRREKLAPSMIAAGISITFTHVLPSEAKEIRIQVRTTEFKSMKKPWTVADPRFARRSRDLNPGCA